MDGGWGDGGGGGDGDGGGGAVGGGGGEGDTVFSAVFLPFAGDATRATSAAMSATVAHRGCDGARMLALEGGAGESIGGIGGMGCISANVRMDGSMLSALFVLSE